MAARIVHFGGDGCNRLAILQLAGYQVEDCDSLPGLLSALSDGFPTAAVVITELAGDPGDAVVETARDHCHAPIILFQSPGCRCAEEEFDLVIPTLTPPRSWLNKIAAIIEQSKTVDAESHSLAEASARLRIESAALRYRSAQEREPGRQPRNRKPPFTPSDC